MGMMPRELQLQRIDRHWRPRTCWLPGPSQAGSLVQVIAAAPPEYIPEAALQTSQGCMAVHSCAIHYAPAIHHAHTKVSFQA